MNRKGKTRAAAGEDWEERLERFLSSPLAERAGQGLSDRISVALHADGQDFFFGRQKGRLTVTRVEALKPDIHFWTKLSTLRHLLDQAEGPSAGVATLGVAIFERVFSQDEERKISFRLDGGFLALWSKGYFSVLKAGGPEVASYLARSGYNGLGAIKEVLKTFRKDRPSRQRD